MTAYPGQTRTMLGQLCAALWDSQSKLDVIQLGFKPRTVVMSLALRCSALDRCATREPNINKPFVKSTFVQVQIGPTIHSGKTTLA
jgi:hypothetical protein